jgi:hypothetical protein
MSQPSETKATTTPARKRKRRKTVRKPAAKVQVTATEPKVETPDVKPPESPVVETDARSQLVSLGPVECRMRRVPVETVLGLLSPEGLRRIEAHQSTASFESTCQRLLATDGLATPVIFEGTDPPSILHGFEELAAAQVCGVPEVSVILVPAGGASEAQSHIVEMVRRQRAKGQTSDDDELFYRVHAEG